MEDIIKILKKMNPEFNFWEEKGCIVTEATILRSLRTPLWMFVTNHTGFNFLKIEIKPGYYKEYYIFCNTSMGEHLPHKRFENYNRGLY
ncbi:MAG: hypothetical protein HFJ37_01600 [Clostridia bacterium]|nr:hypothetical protein [Clostridia bacterium]